MEFALIVPLLMLILFGIIGFGRAYSVQISLTQAARAAARSMVVENNQGTANSAGQLNIVGLGGAAFNYSPGACAKDVTMTVTVSYTMAGLATLPAVPMTGKASMRCGG